MSEIAEFDKVISKPTKGYLGKATANPFLKWAGGKRPLVPDIVKSLPETFNEYHEPFIGGGAVYFAIEQLLAKAHISDSNLDLIITYRALQDVPEKVIARLTEHAKEHGKSYYASVRSQHNLTDPVEVAARFVYLNKTCFNGLYRVNQSGRFNVPMGNYKNPTICDSKNLANVSVALSKATITCQSFMDVQVANGDLVYCDPPYDETYTSYTRDGFTEEHQTNLRNKCVEWMKDGAFVIVSNSDTALIRKLYSQFRIVEVQAPRNISCKASERGKAGELLIYGYN